ncbi:MAG TPA: chemotaxis protein CheW [Thermoanaerobaculia bacterium]|nr:chemotaxis protein CheW [Thermoanaerobaculia bacterium]
MDRPDLDDQDHEPAGAARPAGSHLLVRAGDFICALPLGSVRRVMRALSVHPLPGAAPELKGLAEFAGEPLPILDLARLVGAPAGANRPFPVTIVAWAGPPAAREAVGFAAEAALEVAFVPPGSVVGGDGGFILGEASVAGEVVRVLDLEALGRR